MVYLINGHFSEVVDEEFHVFPNGHQVILQREAVALEFEDQSCQPLAVPITLSHSLLEGVQNGRVAEDSLEGEALLRCQVLAR